MSVLSHLTSTAGKLILRSSESDSIRTSVATIRARAKQYFDDDLVALLKFGSYTRKTLLPHAVDVRSDVDYMFVFDNSDFLKPQTFIRRLRRFAKKYYSTSEIKQSHPTVVLSLNHINFDLVPAYRNWIGTLKIPAPASDFTDWMPTNPKGFNDELMETNKAQQYKMLPLIRLMKYWNAENKYVYVSYDLEKRLTRKSYWFCSNLKEYFFTAVSALDTWNLPDYKTRRVELAKRIVDEIKQQEKNGFPGIAEKRTKKLIPLL